MVEKQLALISEDKDITDYREKREKAKGYAKEHLEDSTKTVGEFLTTLIQKSKFINIKEDLTGIKETAKEMLGKGIQATKDNLPEIKKSTVVMLSFLEKHLGDKGKKLETHLQIGKNKVKVDGDAIRKIISEVDSDNFGKIAVKITNTGIKAITVIILDRMGVKKKYTMMIVSSKPMNSLTEKVSQGIVDKSAKKAVRG